MGNQPKEGSSSLSSEPEPSYTFAGTIPPLRIDPAEKSTLVSEHIRDQKEDQFGRILREYGPALARLAFGYERVASVREELMQEIALAIWQALPHFRGECSERTFVYRIGHNRGLTHAYRRRPAHQPLDELPQPVGAGGSETAAGRTSGDNAPA